MPAPKPARWLALSGTLERQGEDEKAEAEADVEADAKAVNGSMSESEPGQIGADRAAREAEDQDAALDAVVGADEAEDGVAAAAPAPAPPAMAARRTRCWAPAQPSSPGWKAVMSKTGLRDEADLMDAAGT